MKSFGIYSNPVKDKGFKNAIRIAGILEGKGIPYSVDVQMKDAFPEAPLTDDMRPDVMLILGGDGTVLSAARKYAPLGALLLGINLGRLGFLLETEMEQAEAAIERVIKGEYQVEKRIMLKAEVINAAGEKSSGSLALNDAVISRKRILRMIDLSVSINGVHADRFVADGVIVSTPTGSTGYSLSAGGPIVWPGLDVLLITPISPHRLSSKSMVISKNDELEIVWAHDDEGALLTLDGQDSVELMPGDRIRIGNADRSADFIRFDGWDFYGLLKEKLSEWNS